MKTITVAGGTLYHIAATELADATQWIRLAQLNNLSDPILQGLITLTIPTPDPSKTGGVPVSGA